MKLGSTWLRISEKEDWHSKVSIIKSDETWIINGVDGMILGIGIE